MQETKERVALTSIAASGGLTIAKAIVGLLSGSLALLSEAAHSALDFAATVMTWYAVRISGKPADEEHHYGHGKVESVAALIETGLLFVLSGVRDLGGARSGSPEREGHAVEATRLGLRRHRRVDRRRLPARARCSIASPRRRRARRSKPTRCISAPTCGRRSRC